MGLPLRESRPFYHAAEWINIFNRFLVFCPADRHDEFLFRHTSTLYAGKSSPKKFFSSRACVCVCVLFSPTQTTLHLIKNTVVETKSGLKVTVSLDFVRGFRILFLLETALCYKKIKKFFLMPFIMLTFNANNKYVFIN